MRRLSAFALLIILAATAAACGSNSSKLVENKTNVVTSFYPLYYLASEIGGDYTNVINLIPTGVEPHDWTPKSKDLDIASKAQLFLYNGAGLEGWTEDFLEGLSKDSKLITAEMSKGITLIQGNPESEEEHDAHEGHEDSEAHDEHNADSDGDEHALDVDPHVWVSPKSMLIMAENVKSSLVQVDPSHKDNYENNYEALRDKLEALDAKYTEALSNTARKDIVVSHQAFGYLARDYGLKQTAVMGLSPDAEPRAQDLLRIAKFVKENDIPYIFFEELVSPELANTLASEADVETLVLNPVEGLTPEQEKNGDNLITVMEANLQNLLKALQ
ncbi:zinc ABC transporter substrate-binding protein [Paenibacillus sp. NEAU-GSW1]|uniref:metal ABC transporter solute-binding protein, Zn/Mn family n=1 Tax=Paenibacillus sp. NEAU-GSW1 TaxID=2682486 RepID=UPI0012E272D3|nr:zinc ABC transporter substrate-binding protein [Paenibacillus sp. NEAU-GSW1]MUT66725.1 ABC transporter substrate-binding protein [Paenibacillus sp. NEAU-GSW1]